MGALDSRPRSSGDHKLFLGATLRYLAGVASWSVDPLPWGSHLTAVDTRRSREI
jgi:hypothetical protein